jgi:mono/diheme cytochrome c family protein
MDSLEGNRMRMLTLYVAMALALFGGNAASLAQNTENGQRLSERWCVGCHAIGAPTPKTSRIVSFASIAERPGITSEMIASFLLMPHATMPNLPLSHNDAQDIAAFIMKMKRQPQSN